MPAEIDGAVELRQAMERFTPNLAKNLKSRIEKALAPIVNDARSMVPGAAPLSTWQAYSMDNKGTFPRFNSLEVRRGITYSTNPTRPNKKGFSYAASIANKTAAGAIYETAGRKNKNGRPKNPYLHNRSMLLEMNPDLAPALSKKMKSSKYSQSANPNAGKQFIQSMPPLVDGRPTKMRGRKGRNMKGRLIYKAWAKDQGHAYDAVNKALQESIDTFKATTIAKVIGTATYKRVA